METKKAWKEKGFTMAELLIVVAIIAVLAAIAIPIFSNQLEKSREGTDADALRNAYAKAALAALDVANFKADDFLESATLSGGDGHIVVKTKGGAVEFSQTVDNWTELGNFNIGDLEIAKESKAALDTDNTSKPPISFVFDSTGKLVYMQIGSDSTIAYGSKPSGVTVS